MGRGDKRTAKGKRFKGSYGNSRPQRLQEGLATAAPKKEKAEKPAAKKAPAKKKAAAKKKAE